MLLEIITPEKSIFKGKVSLVQLPGSTGSFEIMYNHAPMVAFLKAGNVKIVDPEKGVVNIEISGGTLEVENNSILILAEQK